MESKTENRVKRILSYFVPSFIIMMILCAIVYIVDNRVGLSGIFFESVKDARDTANNFFLVEVQVAFITLSLSTALSTSSKRVYWEETYKYRLVSPKYTNFTALSAYILAVLLAGMIWCFVGFIFGLNTVACMFLSFIISVFLLIFLSARMIDANFGRERIKKELEENLSGKISTKSQHIGRDVGGMLPEIHKLKQVTYQEIDEKELDLVSENIYLLQKLGMKNELSELYRYAVSTCSSKAIIREIEYLIMKQAVQDKDIAFFYRCPIADDDQYYIWEQIINDIFDEAVSKWKSGKKDEALAARADMYTVLTKYLVCRVEGIDCPLYDEVNDKYVSPSTEEMNREMSRIIRLMATFVSRRENWWIDHQIDDKLDSDWEKSERDLVDIDVFKREYDDGDSENELDILVETVMSELKKGKIRWDEGLADEMKKAKRY